MKKLELTLFGCIISVVVTVLENYYNMNLILQKVKFTAPSPFEMFLY